MSNLMPLHGLPSLRRSPAALLCAAALAACVLMSILGEWITGQDPADLAALDLANALLPPAWLEAGRPPHWLGTDAQGRDMLSALLYGMRVSLMVSVASVVVSVVMGVSLGLLSGFRGGKVDAFVMRICDVMLSFPAILVALMVDGTARALFPAAHDEMAGGVMVAAIALSGWVQYARVVRGLAMVERRKEYIEAARIIGLSAVRIMYRHVLPNVAPSVAVLATVHVASAILLEATLSFLGVGMPPAAPSLGTLVRIGNDFLLSGEWWIAAFPGIALVVLALSINLLGDWLRDAWDPRLR